MSNTSVTQQEIDKVEIYTEEVQEIMSYIPHWMIRWGISAITCIIMVLVFLSWFIRYPEIIQAKITLSTIPPPIRVVSQSSGTISKLFVKEGEYVHKGDYLIALESAANIENVLILEQQLQKFANRQIDRESLIFLDQLGSIQDTYNAWVKNLAEEDFHVNSSGFREKQIRHLELQRNELEMITKGLSNQLGLRKRELEIAQHEFGVDQGLFQKNVIARVELEQSEKNYLQQKLGLEQITNQIHSNQIQIRDYAKSINQLQQETLRNSHNLSIAGMDTYQRLLSRLAQWKQEYILVAPASGKLSFFDIWALHQFVSSGTPVVSIIPGSTQVIGKLALGTQGAGQVKIGQSVNIKLDTYNPQHYGMLNGTIKHISALPKEEVFSVDVVLPEGLITTYGHKLNNQAEMTGTAEIITENLRLIERIFNQLRLLVDK